MPATEILRADGVHKRYGGVHALRGAHLHVRPGEVHALVGENGSGKSTLLKILSGQVQPRQRRDHARRASRCSFRNADGRAAAGHRDGDAGDDARARSLDRGERLPRAPHGRGAAASSTGAATRRRAREALARLGLDLDPSLPVRRLRPDQQQMVEIARALSIDARVLILDEPTSSLTDDEVESLFRVVRRLREEGVAMIFVSHRLSEIFQLADRVTVLRDGHTVGEGPLSELDRPQLIELMVGRALEDCRATSGSASELGDRARARGARPHACRARSTRSTSTSPRARSSGSPGSSAPGAASCSRRSSACASRTGTRRGRRSRRHATASRSRRCADGVAFVPADRKRQGLVLQMTVLENLMMAVDLAASRGCGRRERGEELAVAHADDLRAADPHALAARRRSRRSRAATSRRSCSGSGSTTSPKVLMLDEPTRGVDVGAKAEIYRLLFSSAEQGIGILVSSSEVPELLTLCDRILVLFRGRVVATLSRDEATEARIAHFAGGHHEA